MQGGANPLPKSYSGPSVPLRGVGIAWAAVVGTPGSSPSLPYQRPTRPPPLPAHTWQSTFNSIPSFYLPHPCWASTETLSPIDLKYDTVSVTHITHTAFIKPYIFCHPYNSPIHTERGQIHFTSSLQFSNINLGLCSSHVAIHSIQVGSDLSDFIPMFYIPQLHIFHTLMPIQISFQ